MVEGGRRLVDVEGRGELDLVIDEAAVQRLSRTVQPSAARACRRAARRVGAALRPRRRRHAGSSTWREALARRECWRPHDLQRRRWDCWRCWPFRRSWPSICFAGGFRFVPSPGCSSGRSLRQTPEGGGRITRLPITASLILECLAALALALILAGARCRPAGVSAASGRAARRFGVDGGGQRAGREPARSGGAARARRNRSARPRRARHACPERRAPVGARRPGRACRRSAARAGRLEAGGAASFARSRPASGARARRPDRQLMVISDAPPGSRKSERRLLWVSVGEPLANVGITAAQRTLSPDGRPRRDLADASATRPTENGAPPAAA